MKNSPSYPSQLSVVLQLILVLLFSYFCLLSTRDHSQIRHMAEAQTATTTVIDVGVILDLDTLVGNISQICLSMALSDFYSTHNNYKTRLVLHIRNSNSDTIDAASAAIDLLKNVQAQAILGPQKSAQAEFIVNIGNKARVPIISFSATSPSLSFFKTHYFIRTTLDDSSQVKAIASIVQAFGWREVVPIYEDTPYGNDIIPYLTDAIQDINAQIPYKSVISHLATDDEIVEELYKLMTMQSRVFVVHMAFPLGSRLFLKAKEAGMMDKGYVWIITDGLTNLLGSMNSSIIESMEGVIGIKPFVPGSKELDNFKIRWRRKFIQENPDIDTAELNILGLQAYDSLWALAMAVEKIDKFEGHRFVKPTSIIKNSNIDLATIGVSQIGTKLLQAILSTNFQGLSGEFKLMNGELQPSAFQIVNVIGKGERRIGFWTPALGITKKLGRPSETKTYSASMLDLGAIIWPGDSTQVPKGWEVPTSKKLRIGVPVKKGFSEFVKVVIDPRTKAMEFTGFCIDVFIAVMELLPYPIPYQFVPFAMDDGQIAEDYDNLVYEVYLQKYDVVVGDITILPNRSLYADFTLPYTETGVSMIVRIEDGDKKDSWVFLKPLSIGLWLITGAAFIFTGSVIWILEHRINTNFRGSPTDQIGMIFWFAFSTIVFAHRERVLSNLSRLVLIIWLFVVLILTSSYTASLTTKLTVQQLTVSDINQLVRNGDYVGYQQGSHVKGILKRLHIDESKLRGYQDPSEYAEALSRGSQKGGVAAIFDEIPYLRLFLSKYCDKYAMVGPTYNTYGFGFVFRKGSPLALDVSNVILDAKEERVMNIELKWFGNKTTCQNPGSRVSSDSFTIDSFRGLFLITAVTSIVAVLIFIGFFIHENMHILTDKSISPVKRLVRLVILFYREENLVIPGILEQPHEQGQGIIERPHEQGQGVIERTPEQGQVISRSDSSVSSQENNSIEADHHNTGI